MLFGGAFEDRLPRRVEPGGQTLVEDDLQRRGGSAEAAAAKASMRALMASAVSLSEASEIVPGRLVLARDLVRGGEPVRVTTRVGAAWRSRLPRNGVASLFLAGEPLAGGAPSTGPNTAAEPTGPA